MFSADNTIEDKTKGILSLATIKKNIEDAWKYFEANYNRYNDFYNFVFKTALTDDDRATLSRLGKPIIEFPILEAYISRLRGEFSKQQPQIDVRAAEGLAIGKLNDDYLKLLNVIQAHLNEIFFEADNDEFTYDIYSDTLAGGFSVAKVYTDYVNEKSFMQKICIERVFNPTMCGFDPLATKSHKGDGRFCFELHPMAQEEFEEEFGAEKAKAFNFTRAVEGFNWLYKNNDTKIVLVADYYVKVQKVLTLVRLAPSEYAPETMSIKDYNKMVREWDKIEQVPEILEKRKSTVTTVDRYRVCQNEILDHVETSYPMLPLVYIDGNSVMLKNTDGGQIEQMTRPYVYNAKGVQKLKNFAGQTVGQELEDMPQYKLIIPVEGIPKKYESIYQNPQIPATIVYNQFDVKQPGVRLDPPQAFPRIPTPPLVNEVFMGSDATTQAILGSYDAILGVNDKQISGVAIQQGAMQSNAAAIPYLMGYIKGMQRCAEIVIHLLPLFYTMPRSIPVKLPNGKRDYQIINTPYPKEDKQKKMLMKAQEMGMGGEMGEETGQQAETEEQENAIMFNYDPADMNVRIEPGVNQAIQKQVAVDQLTALMNTSAIFKAFMERQGLGVLIKNLDIKGAEALDEMVEQFQAQAEHERQQAGQQPTDADKIAQAEIQKAMLEAQARKEKTQADFALGIAKAAEMQAETEIKRQELELKAAEAHVRLSMDRENAASQAASDTIGLAVDVMKHQSEMSMQERQSQAPQGGVNE